MATSQQAIKATRTRKSTVRAAPEPKPRTQATVLPPELDRALKQWAADRGLTPSAAVRMILTERLIRGGE